MSCPICGANCKCRKRGPGGICCSCHRHKVGKRSIIEFVIGMDDTTRVAIETHREWKDREERERVQGELFMR